MQACGQGSRGQQDPIPGRKARPKGRSDAPWPTQVPNRWVAVLAGDQEPELRAHPTSPSLQSGAQLPWAGRSSQGPGQVLKGEHRGVQAGGTHRWVWRQESRAENGAAAARRDPGEEPGRGFMERGAVARAGCFRRGLRALQPSPQCLEPLAKRAAQRPHL